MYTLNNLNILFIHLIFYFDIIYELILEEIGSFNTKRKNDLFIINLIFPIILLKILNIDLFDIYLMDYEDYLFLKK